MCIITSKPKKPNTIWNVLALLAILVGGGVTLLTSIAYLNDWARNSGQRYPVGQWAEVELQPGEYQFFYESADSVPTAWLFEVYDPAGERLHPRQADEEEMYRLLLGGWSGKAVGILGVEEAGLYRLRVNNASLQSDEVPDDDVYVFAKSLPSWAEADAVRKQILIIGASITLALVVIFYILHAITIRKRTQQRAQDPPRTDFDQTMDVAV